VGGGGESVTNVVMCLSPPQVQSTLSYGKQTHIYVDNFYCEMFRHKFHLKFKNVILNMKPHDYNPPSHTKKVND